MATNSIWIVAKSKVTYRTIAMRTMIDPAPISYWEHHLPYNIYVVVGPNI